MPFCSRAIYTSSKQLLQRQRILQTFPPHSLARARVQTRTMSSQQEIPKTMKAIQVEKTGGPEVNVLNDVAVPKPKDDEVLIKVQWSGINYIDNYFRSGLYPRPLPFTPGQDVVGTLLSLPSASSTSTSLPKLEIGQTVFSPASNAFAEYTTAPWWKVVPVKAGSFEPKWGVPMSTTAFTMAYLVKESYEVRKGDTVLIRAAAGGVGLLLCQICKHLGALVIATTSTEAKAKLAKENGADHVLLSGDESASNVKKILDLTGGKGVHVVYDGVGKDTFEEDFEVVRSKGTIVTFGNASGAPPAFSPLKLSPKSLKITRPTMNAFIDTPESFAAYAKMILDWTEQGVLKYDIHKEYPFTAEGVAQAEIDISGRGTTGKLLIKVSD